MRRLIINTLNRVLTKSKTMLAHLGGIVTGVGANIFTAAAFQHLLRTYSTQNPVLAVGTIACAAVVVSHKPTMIRPALNAAAFCIRNTYKAGNLLGEELAVRLMDAQLAGITYAYNGIQPVVANKLDQMASCARDCTFDVIKRVRNLSPL